MHLKIKGTTAHCHAAVLVLAVLSGCGTVQTRHATDQLLVSDAVDQSIAKLSFTALAGKSVYLDTQYLRQVGGVGFVNADYITSALREHMVADRCRLQDNRHEADYVVEVRVGALGTDGHDINYGIPGGGVISATTALLGSGAPIPAIPEISLARRDERRAAAKIGVFAYHRESKEPIWTPDVVQGNSVAKATWFLGAGPFHDGRIYQESTMGQDVLPMPNVDSGRHLVSNVADKVKRLMPHQLTPEERLPAVPAPLGNPVTQDNLEVFSRLPQTPALSSGSPPAAG